MDTKSIIEIICASTIPFVVLAIIAHRIWCDMGIGVRAIQFVALVTIACLILILALEGILEKSAVGALVGALVGYFFSNIGKYDENIGGNKPKATD